MGEIKIFIQLCGRQEVIMRYRVEERPANQRLVFNAPGIKRIALPAAKRFSIK
jgi:hypothetical protein